MVREHSGLCLFICNSSGLLKLKAFPLLQAFPEAAAFVLCVCQHAELCVSLAGHHFAHPAQPTARDPACGSPQAPRPPCSTGTAETDTLANFLSLHPLPSVSPTIYTI